MSNSDPNSSATVPATPANTIRTPLPPTPPPLPPPYRAVAPFHYPIPFQQAPTNQYPPRRPNSPHQVVHQDPSTFVYPFASPGRGYSTRPVRVGSPFVGENQSGYPPRPVMAYSQRQFSPGEVESMMQFMRARNPQILHHVPYTGSGSPVGPGPMRGVPHFLQPRVAPPPTSILDNSRTEYSRSRGDALVLVRGRKVRITEGASLYSLCRSWLGNGAHEGTQSLRNYTMMPLPKPLPVEMMEASVPNDPGEEPTNENKEDEESVKQLSEKDLLKRHIERAKKVRARLREERLRKIARYKARLALLLPQSGEQCKKND